MSKRRKYLIITFAITLVITIFGWFCGEDVFDFTLAIAMFIPLIAAFFAGADISEMGWGIRLELKSLLLLLTAWLLPTVMSIMGGLLYYLVFPEDYIHSDGFLNIISDSLSPFILFVPCILALGEETGWRGFLYPELKRKFGRIKGRLLGGVIWGAWHFPAMLIAGYEYGREYIGAPLLGLFAFPLFCTAAGIIADFLYEQSESIWLPTLFHACINASPDMWFFRNDLHPERSIFGPSDIGLIGVIPTLFIAASILYYEMKSDASIEWE